MTIIEGISSAWEATKGYLRDTYVEVIAGFLLGALAGGLASYSYESSRSIPLGFSEISQREIEAKMNGRGLGPINQFYPKLNDAIMKPLEARNISADNKTRFARELEVITDPAMKIHHYNETILLYELPKIVDESKKELDNCISVEKKLRPIISDMEATWDESHSDVYRPEVRVEIHTDSKGNTYTTTHIEMVYDHTVHTYTYYPEKGNKVASELSNFTKDVPRLDWPEELVLVKQTNAEGEYAAEKSRNDSKRLSREELLAIANGCINFAIYGKNKDPILNSFREIPAHRDKWNINKNSAHNETYSTNSRSDVGPEEYQTIENAKETAEEYCKRLDEILYGMDLVKNKAPKLQKNIQGYIDVVLNKKEGSPKAFENRITATLYEWTDANFSGRYELSPVRAYWIALWAFLAGCAGAGLGKVLDYAGNKFNLWEPKPVLEAIPFRRRKKLMRN